MEIPSYLFPDSTKFELNQWLVDKIQKHITLKLTSKQTLVDCPGCYQPTHRIHSYYKRILTDLSWADYSISLELRVRKFFCDNSECRRRIFTERLEKLASPWARRTQRLTDQLTAVAIELGGSAGVRLTRRLGHQVSRNTLLQLICRLPLPPIVTPSILGVDVATHNTKRFRPQSSLV